MFLIIMAIFDAIKTIKLYTVFSTPLIMVELIEEWDWNIKQTIGFQLTASLSQVLVSHLLVRLQHVDSLGFGLVPTQKQVKKPNN